MQISEPVVYGNKQTDLQPGYYGAETNAQSNSQPGSEYRPEATRSITEILGGLTGSPTSSYLVPDYAKVAGQNGYPPDAQVVQPGYLSESQTGRTDQRAVAVPSERANVASAYGFQMGRDMRSVVQENALPQVLNSTGQGIYGAVTSPGNSSEASANRALGVAGSILGGAAGLAGANGNEGLSKGLAVASAAVGVGQSIANKDVTGAALAGLGGVGTAIGGKAGRVISDVVSVGSAAKGVANAVSRGGAIGAGSAISAIAGLAANFIKGTVGKVVSGVASAASIAVQAASAVASGVASVAQGIAGGIVGGIGAAFSLIGGKVGKIIGNVASILAPILMGNPIGAAIGAVAIIAGMLFKPKGRYESNQKADLIGRMPNENGEVVTDRLHRGKKNQLEVFITDAAGKETKTQTIEMGGFFQYKRQAGQDKLVDLQGDGKADLIWQGDKKRANHITTFINLGEGKFGDPAAEAKAAEKLARMDAYIAANPRPVYNTDDISAGSRQLGYQGNRVEALSNKVKGDVSSEAVIRKANVWLNGLEAAINGADGPKVDPFSQRLSYGLGKVRGNGVTPVLDQTKNTGVTNVYKHTAEFMERAKLDKNGNVKAENAGAARTFGSIGGVPLIQKNGEQVDHQALKLEDANSRLTHVIDDSVAAMRKQLEGQSKPEGRVAFEQDLSIGVKKYSAEQMKFADLNSDGVTDMVMTGKYVQGGIWAFLGRGDGSFEATPINITKEVEAQKAAIAAQQQNTNSEVRAA
jgi:hypothetical protein